MKKIYEKPVLELVTFQTEENITASYNATALFGIFPVAPAGSIDE